MKKGDRVKVNETLPGFRKGICKNGKPASQTGTIKGFSKDGSRVIVVWDGTKWPNSCYIGFVDVIEPEDL